MLKNQKFNRLHLLTFLCALVWISSCSKSTPPTHYFYIPAPLPDALQQDSAIQHPGTLILREVRAVPPYNSENLVIMHRDLELGFYTYYKWVTPPQESLYIYMNQWLKHQNLIQYSSRRLFKEGVLVMDLEIHQFGQINQGEEVLGALQVYVSLSEGEEKNLVWQKVYQLQSRAKGNSPYDTVKALYQVTGQFKEQLAKDLNEYLQNRPQSTP